VADRPGEESNDTSQTHDAAVAAGNADPRADRDQVLEALKAAFVQGRLGSDEFVERVGQALAAYAELDALTADIPATPPAAPPAAGEPGVTREAYNRGLVARGTFGGAGGIMLVAFIVVTAVSGNPFLGFLLGGVLGAFMVAVLGGLLTLIMWALESSGGWSSRQTGPPTRGGTTERLAAAEQADVPGQPRQSRRNGRHIAEATRDRRLTHGLLAGVGIAFLDNGLP
jgi:Domain of unknown function (DUF1707)